MTGGADRDVFDFNLVSETGKSASTRDVIRDFRVGEDKIDLSTIDANSRSNGNTTIVYGDVNGDKVADFQIELSGLMRVNVSDFLL